MLRSSSANSDDKRRVNIASASRSTSHDASISN